MWTRSVSTESMCDTMRDFAIASAQLRSTEPVSGVRLESYVKCRVASETVHQFAEEQTGDAASTDFAVRYRWLRSPESADAANEQVCHIHPDRPGAIYCGFWKSEYSLYGYPFSDACHCSIECFQRNWRLQLTYWEKVQSAKQLASAGSSPLLPVDPLS